MDLIRPRHVKVSSPWVIFAICFCVMFGFICGAERAVTWAAEPTLKGLWAPVDGEVGRRGISHLSIGGEGALYAIGSGNIWRYGSNKSVEPRNKNIEAVEEKTWQSYGRYAPTLSWDESVGIDASGPFSAILLSEVERLVSESIEAALEGQGDEDWISEDAAFSIIEAFEAESSPAIDSPYRVNAVFPQGEGVWVATGAGLWATHHSKVAVPLPESPTPAMSVIQLGDELWVSTDQELFQSQQYLKYAEDSESGSVSDSPLVWRSRLSLNNALMFHYRGEGFAFASGELVGLTPRAEQTPPIIPAGTYALTPSSQFESSESLWAITPEGVWFTRSAPNETFSWTRCISLDQPVTHLKVNDTGALLVSPERLVFISPDCQRVKVFSPPLSEGVIFMDAEWWGNRLYGATSGGLFVWEDESDLSISKAGVRYLKRDLALFPRFYIVFQAALIEQGLDPRRGGYGARPVLSALLPQVTLRYTTRPSRDDQRPTFSTGSRQLTLLQPRPEYSMFFEWRISLDFLSALVDPELGSAYFEAQNQIETLITDPSASVDMESEVGLFDDWSDDTFTSQAQRLAMTTLALERRQKHRDRAQLRAKVARLHRERIKMTYKQWLKGESFTDSQRAINRLRLREIDARLDAMTGYQLNIQDRMNPAL